MPENIDPPTPDELANASNNLGDPQAAPPKLSRQERANAIRPLIEKLLNSVRAHLDANELSKATAALNKARALDDQLSTLTKFKDDEEHRSFLINWMENGYH